VHEAVAESGARHGTPPIETGALGVDGGLVGAAESVFDVLLDDVPRLTRPLTLPLTEEPG